MNILVISRLYPVDDSDFSGMFNHVVFRELRGKCRFEVIRPEPYAPRLMNARSWKKRISKIRVPRSYVLDGIRVHCPRFLSLPGGIGWAREGDRQYTAALPFVEKVHRKAPFDFVFGGMLTPDGSTALRFGETLGLPVMVASVGSDAHTIPYLSDATYRETRRVLSLADTVLVESASTVNDVQKIAPKTLPLVFNRGIDLEPFRNVERAKEVPRGRQMIVMVGRMTREKGVEELVRAYDLIHAEFSNVDLMIVGEGDLRNWITKYSLDRGWQARVHLVGQKPAGQVAEYLKTADVFCLPSHAEGLPKSVLEAMAMRLPVVATSVGGIPDVIDHLENGMLVPPRSPRALADALRQLLGSSDLRFRIGESGRKYVVEKQDVRKNALTFLSHSERLFENGIRRPKESPLAR